MRKAIAIIVDWFGPYDLPAAREASRRDFGAGAYVAIGKQKYQSSTWIQYIGISSSNLCQRLAEDHSKLRLITRGRKIWLGEVASVGVSGPKQKRTDFLLDLVEWAHAFFLELPLNERKRLAPPRRAITVVNRWWGTDFFTPKRRRPHTDWPIVIDYAGGGYPVRMSWRWDRSTVPHELA